MVLTNLIERSAQAIPLAPFMHAQVGAAADWPPLPLQAVPDSRDEPSDARQLWHAQAQVPIIHHTRGCHATNYSSVALMRLDAGSLSFFFPHLAGSGGGAPRQFRAHNDVIP